jgi:hypothetical protein
MKAVLQSLVVVFALSLFATGGVAASESDPETVLVTYHVKEGKADELARMLDLTWATYRRLGLVFEKPHLVMRGEEESGVFFAEILPWKSHSAPDHAPPEVKALWDQIQFLCERRHGRDTIEIPEVEIMRNES